ncbi:TIGR03618 family F420-dependent PPOX class oxidoreductase [Micromonospora musae]|uniref:TIGR03618 family F420-dependent PPOX class oxidoreductase n=1 Tax=Micromonospora musae TaxID=1894970 RepID=UPI003438F57A
MNDRTGGVRPAPLPPAVEARLAQDPRAWLCTLRPDGSPHVTPVWFVHAGGTWWVGCAEQSVKVRNVLADPRVSLALEDGIAPVVAEGVARVRRSAFPAQVVAAFAGKYDGWDVRRPETPQGRRVLLEVPVRRWLLAGRAQ